MRNFSIKKVQLNLISYKSFFYKFKPFDEKNVDLSLSLCEDSGESFFQEISSTLGSFIEKFAKIAPVQSFELLNEDLALINSEITMSKTFKPEIWYSWKLPSLLIKKFIEFDKQNAIKGLKNDISRSIFSICLGFKSTVIY